MPKTKKPFDDEIVLVTGAGRGLGKELCLKFASLNAKVVLWDINQKAVTDVAAEIRSKGGEAYAFKVDIANLEEVERTAEKVRNEVGDVTVLVNNAGIIQNVHFLDLVNERIKQTIEVNTLSHFWTLKQFLPRMIEMDHGHVVAVASLSALIGWIYMADYSASKFAILGMMESLEEDIRLLGKSKYIHCTTVCPSTINTGMNHAPSSRINVADKRNLTRKTVKSPKKRRRKKAIENVTLGDFDVDVIHESYAVEKKVLTVPKLIPVLKEKNIFLGKEKYAWYKWLTPLLPVEYAAADIINAIQTNERLVTIPRRMYCPLAFKLLFPRRVVQHVLDFLQYNMNTNDPLRFGA